MNKYSTKGSTTGVLITQNRVIKNRAYNELSIDRLVLEWLKIKFKTTLVAAEIGDYIVYYDCSSTGKPNRKINKLKMIHDIIEDKNDERINFKIKGHVFIRSKTGDFDIHDFGKLETIPLN